MEGPVDDGEARWQTPRWGMSMDIDWHLGKHEGTAGAWEHSTRRPQTELQNGVIADLRLAKDQNADEIPPPPPSSLSTPSLAPPPLEKEKS